MNGSYAFEDGLLALCEASLNHLDDHLNVDHHHHYHHVIWYLGLGIWYRIFGHCIVVLDSGIFNILDFVFCILFGVFGI